MHQIRLLKHPISKNMGLAMQWMMPVYLGGICATYLFLMADMAKSLLFQEGENMPNILLQEKFHRWILRGLRNLSDTP